MLEHIAGRLVRIGCEITGHTVEGFDPTRMERVRRIVRDMQLEDELDGEGVRREVSVSCACGKKLILIEPWDRP